ncbi:MAG: Eco57I restriction-modification methylase domain-containing protein [Syntrophales bacterium]|nr:Eco57I restriction-modification methylase domain-containing protein [Syntrophales bacterium]
MAYGNNRFSPDTEKVLQMAPFLNGELFKQVPGLDDIGYSIPDMQVEKFFDFLAQYNFTIDENTITDEELELNPEFLGIIFERLVNQEDGAVYTPRTEVDFMCRIALVKWLEKNSTCGKKDLYRFLFRELGSGDESEEDQHQGDFSPREMKELHGLLSRVTVCDPAAGSGAFEVGMLHVLHDALDNLERRPHFPEDIQKLDSFERKKEIIANTLYGVEVKKWAVWINQLRLWLTLFIDMPEDFRMSREPLLPSLGFKVRCGDSLVQRVGGRLFPVRGDALIGETAKRRLKSLQKHKYDFFFNRGKTYEFVRQEEYQVFRTILEEEIKQKETVLTQLRGSMAGQEGQGGLGFSEGQTGIGDRSLRQNQERIAELESEADELRLECRKLVADHPFVWNIEFSEIFFDKGGFDVVIGNPPYVSKEKIKDPLGKVESATEYKELLRQMVALDFPGHFGSGRSINGRSDLYTYFYIRSLRILNPKGIHVFICSNSWLDVGYGAWLQEFLLLNVPVHFIFDNQAKRSFANADINTVITVMGAPEEREHSLDNLLRFVSIRKPFEESVFTENLLAIEESKSCFTGETMRVVPTSAKDLLEEGMDISEEGQNSISGIYTGNKWGGKYLRAPDFYLHLINSNEIRFLKFDGVLGSKKIVKIIGYVHDNNVGDNFPKTKFIKSIKDASRINISENEVIIKGVKDTGNSRVLADVLFPRTFGEKHLVLLNGLGVVGKEFYRLIAEGIPKDSLALYINSTFCILQRELLGLVNLGGGAIKFSAEDIKMFIIPKSLVRCFFFSEKEIFLNREIQSVFKEIGINPELGIPISEQDPNPLPDRAALDKIVFDALDLTEEERKEVYRAVCQLVWNRISRARSV